MLRTELLQEGGKDSLKNIKVDLFNKKTILITGASGIVGTHFVYSLKYLKEALEIDLNIIAIVNRGIPEHFNPLLDKNYITFYCGDLTNESFLNSLPEADYIIHAATYGQPGKFMEFPEITIKLNTTVTMFLLEKRLKQNGKFLFISSSEVYSGLPMPPYDEAQIGTTTPNHSRACYIEAKRCGEAITSIFKQKGVSAVSARLSLAYGPGTKSDDRRVLNNFIEKALLNKEIKLMDSGSAKRTYCFVSDAVNMMWMILFDGTQDVYNIGGISSLTIFELATLIGKITNVPVVKPSVISEGVSGAPEDVRLDLSRFNKEFGELNFCDIQKGLEKTIAWQSSMFLNK
jgi:nucleoside-diphosphate-sugar epimerase